MSTFWICAWLREFAPVCANLRAKLRMVFAPKVSKLVQKSVRFKNLIVSWDSARLFKERSNGLQDHLHTD